MTTTTTVSGRAVARLLDGLHAIKHTSEEVLS